MTTNPYKCESHKLDLVCRGCMQAWIARHNKLLEFVKSISKNSCCINCQCLACDALELLREIGEAE